LPDDVAEKVQQLAAEMGISVDQCLALAVHRYVTDDRAETVTEALNEVYAHEPSSMEPALARLQAASISREQW
jgi:hypothetical protein